MPKMPVTPRLKMPAPLAQLGRLARLLAWVCASHFAAGLAVAQTTPPAGSTAPAPAPSAPSSTPAAATQFAIKAYKVLGNTLLNAKRVETITEQYTGAQSDFETIQRAVEALEKAYVNAGFGSVVVEVPEQELQGGVVTLQVVEGKLGEIKVEANAHFDEANVKNSLPALRTGETTNTAELNRNLGLANDGGVKNTSVTFKRNAVTGLSDALVKVTAEDPERWLALLDNTGAAATGLYRAGLIYQHGNLFNRDHALSVQLMSSPGYWRQVGIVGVGYRIPFYGLGGTLDVNASYSNVDSGKVAGAGGGPDLSISGSGNTFGLKYTHLFDATPELQHRVSLGLEHRNFGNSVTLTGVPGASLVPDLATRPLTLAYSGQYRVAERDSSYSISVSKNLPGAANGSTTDFNQPGGRAGATANFHMLKFNLQATERWPSQWSLRGAVSGQLTTQLLISPEQFGAGGADSVRGFSEREAAGDRGWRAGLEVWAPPFEASPWRLVPLAFADAAEAVRNQPAAGEIERQQISSAGLGLRATMGRHLNLRVDWGHVLRGVNGIAGARAGDSRLHATLIWNFQ